MLQTVSLGLIGVYQRHLSPRKGYCCAYRASTGGRSCSSYGHAAIARAGLLRGLLLLRRRFRLCAAAALAHSTNQPEEKKGGAFGECTPAVNAAKELCCGSCIGGLSQGGS